MTEATVSGSLGATEHIDLDLADASVRYFPRLFAPAEADRLFGELMETTPWSHETIVVYGRRLPQPRLTAWFADDGGSYTYSGLTLAASAWTACLGQVRSAAEKAAGQRFGVALANLYRDGRDSVAWHADDEPELGPTPVIGSVSFGAVRRFQLRRRRDHDIRHEIELASGSLLVMAGETQRHWMHQVPKTSRQVGPRVNITFRTWIGS